MADTDIATRLERIEEKLEQLSEAMVTLARNEERIISVQNNVSNQNERINRLSAKIDAVDVITRENKQHLDTFSKLFWIFVTAIVVSGVAMWINMR